MSSFLQYCSSLLFIFCCFCTNAHAQNTSFELDSKRNTTATYEELLQFYTALDKQYPECKLLEVGITDVGKPLHLFVMSKDKDFDPESIKAKGKAILLVNNGIHPGEPEGIDVGMLFSRDVLQRNTLPDDVVICLIPVYNVAGMLNRGVSRVNQNGPVTYGFRGSRQNYDLNRDFIKADTRNSLLFQRLFSAWDPDMFFDTHASNGADYQYIMTLIATQKDKIAPPLAALMEERFTKALYQRMQTSGYPMIPYVNTIGATPESGLVDFLETPRYSSGYAALHHTIGFMPETHMWKSYEERVLSTYTLLQHLVNVMVQEREDLLFTRNQVKQSAKTQQIFPITWALDTTRVDSITFMGYQAEQKKSAISGHNRLYYDRAQPKTMQIPHWKHYRVAHEVQKPMAYVIPQAYDRVIERLQANGVQLHPLKQDTMIRLEMYYITAVKTATSPYEGHYMHEDVEIKPVVMERQFYAGDWWIEMDQEANRYLIETLEPQAHDSFFRWNFFDGILSQKEYFSPYIFEEEAQRLLDTNPAWKQELERKKANEPAFAKNGRAQLDWIYKKSIYYEDTHMLYPVGRIVSTRPH